LARAQTAHRHHSEDDVEALTAAIKSNNATLLRDVLARHPRLKARINEPLPNYGFGAPAIVAVPECKL
jgi:hypothetical protein